ncbi:MAG: DUF2339 domain-containing protein [Acidobacteria bacterium]|nr:DUF2339 domain-containing protein [Acidobacteriota bacterium]
MKRISKGDVLFLVVLAIVLLRMFSSFEAGFIGFTDNAWLLLCALAIWIALRARREVRERVAAIETELQRERQERIDAIARLTAQPSRAEPVTETPRPVAAPAPSQALTEWPAPSVQQPANPRIVPDFVEQARWYGTPPIETPPPPPQLGPAPSFAAPEPAEGRASAIRRVLNLEQMLGTNWLSKIGIAVLVFGIGFFLAWQLRELGPPGKVLVGTLVSLVLLAIGVFGERYERYRNLSRAAVAGGWSLAYFTAYAAHHIPAARVITAPVLGLLLMFAVAGAMVGHTLRYRSKTVTGLAFLLAFLTIALNRVDVYSLTANAVLAAGVGFVSLRMEWPELEIFGVITAYATHFVWLVPIIRPMGGRVHPFPQFYASAAILLAYWAIFRAAYVLQRSNRETVTTTAGILNTCLLLAVMKYQSAHPELAFWALLSLGCMELGLGQLTRFRGQRTRFAVLSTIGAALVLSAIPFRYAAIYVSPVWLIQAELLFFVGIFAREAVFRRLGSLAAFATAIQLFAVHGARVFGARFDDSYVVHHWTLGVIFLAAMVGLYTDAHAAPRLWPDLFTFGIDLRMLGYLSHAALVMGAVGAWVMFPGAGAAVLWAALAVALAGFGRRFRIRELIWQANALGVLAFVRAIVINLPSDFIALQGRVRLSYRVVTVAPIAGGGYLLARWNHIGGTKDATLPRRIATWAAFTLIWLLAWYELRPINVALAWAMIALVLLELGLAQGSLDLRLQAYVALVAAFARVFIVNLNAGNTGTQFDARLYTVAPIACALFYMHQRLHECSAKMESQEQRGASLFAWLGVTCIAALVRFEFAPDLVATIWAGLALVVVAAAQLTGRRIFLHSGIALALAVLFRGALHNLYERSYFPWPGKSDPWVLVGGAAALLVGSLPFAFRLRRLNEGPAPASLWKRILMWFDTRPEQILFFVPLVLITLLLSTEMSKGMLTIAWGAEAVAVFVFALWVKERSYRLAGLALLLLCVGKIFVIDFWSLGIRDKALTGILMGLALIGVSILYSRKREAVRQLL